MFIGCQHECLYCYARTTPPGRVHLKKGNSWNTMIRTKKSFENAKKLDGQIMFPTLHDIIPEHLDDTVDFLTKWLQKGNRILITTKPHLKCVQRLCTDLSEYRTQIIFRFTIGSMNNKFLQFWEKNAPLYEERKASLIFAYKQGYETSISCEPRLDAYIDELIEDVSPYVTHSIWLGMMNKIDDRVDTSLWKLKDYMYLNEVKSIQRPAYLQKLYTKYKDNPLICWKNELRETLHLPITVNRGKQ